MTNSVMDIISQIDKARVSLLKERDALATSHSSWKRNDARITVFSKCLHILNSTKLGLRYADDSMKPDRNGWWKEYYETENELPFTGQEYVVEFVTIVRLAFIQFIFSAIESSFRAILKAIDPNACSGGTGDFAGIYSTLLTRLNLQKWSSLLDLLRHIRNTVHNNGVFLPRSGNDVTATYGGKQYAFKVGTRVDFLDWHFLVGLLDDIGIMLLEVVNSSQVIGIPTIDDLSIKA